MVGSTAWHCGPVEYRTREVDQPERRSNRNGAGIAKQHKARRIEPGAGDSAARCAAGLSVGDGKHGNDRVARW
jgi:hypothetical protein